MSASEAGNAASQFSMSASWRESHSCRVTATGMDFMGEEKKLLNKLVCEKTKGHCAYCGKFLEESEVCLDHIKARAKDGQFILENLFPACRKCNCSKRTKSIEEFRRYKGFKYTFSPEQVEFLKRLGFWDAIEFEIEQRAAKIVFYFETLKTTTN